MRGRRTSGCFGGAFVLYVALVASAVWLTYHPEPRSGDIGGLLPMMLTFPGCFLVMPVIGWLPLDFGTMTVAMFTFGGLMNCLIVWTLVQTAAKVKEGVVKLKRKIWKG